MAKHVHAELIKAWADGAEIEVYLGHSDDPRWVPCPQPFWSEGSQYRVKSVPHKWQKEMDAFTAGKPVQWSYNDLKERDWYTCIGPDWNHPRCVFRIKPEKVEQMWYFEEDSHRCGVAHHATQPLGAKSNLKLTFEDGKLVGAEVLK